MIKMLMTIALRKKIVKFGSQTVIKKKTENWKKEKEKGSREKGRLQKKSCSEKTDTKLAPNSGKRKGKVSKLGREQKKT